MLSTMIGLMFLAAPAQAERVPKPYQIGSVQSEHSDYRFQRLRIMFQSEQTQPVVAITSVIDRGSEYDQEGVDGIAHVLEHLAFVPTWWHQTGLDQSNGGTINASTSVNWTNYMTIRDAQYRCCVLKLRMQNGVKGVTEQDVTESEIARNELRMRYENAAVSAAMEVIGSQLYPEGHPYARSTIGNHETLSNITLEKVQEYIEDITSWNTTIVVVGDFDLKDALILCD